MIYDLTIYNFKIHPKMATEETWWATIALYNDAEETTDKPCYRRIIPGMVILHKFSAIGLATARHNKHAGNATKADLS